MSMVTKENSAVALAFTVLIDAVKENPAILRNRRKDIATLAKAAGFEINGEVSATGRSNDQRYPLVIGQPVTHPGIPFSQLTSGNKTINLNLIPDFLRDNSGQIVELNGNEAVDMVAVLNGGVKYDDGYEKAIVRAVARGEFKDGTLILARQEDLSKIARERESNPALEQINKIVASGSNDDSCCVSSSEQRDRPSYVHHVMLKEGDSGWDYNKDGIHSRVVVLRGFNCG